MRGGELVQKSIPLSKLRWMLPEILVDETNQKGLDLDFRNKVGQGYQGIVVNVDASSVAKLFKLKKQFVVPETVEEELVASLYAASIGVGPKIREPPFIIANGQYVAFIMERVTPVTPTETDAAELIALWKTAVFNKFATFDSEFGRTLDSKLIFLDFGISGIYTSPKKALQDLFDNDMFYDTGGFYNEKLETYFIKVKKNMSRASRTLKSRTVKTRKSKVTKGKRKTV